MAAIKVLVVDDALTMRALISTVLGKVKGIEVVGTADGAADARAEIARLRPDVMTLDIEMPGMNGIEFLREVMQTKPIPTIMFSTLTDAGASASIEALSLGAVDCFPKPKVATQVEFEIVVNKLAESIKKAKAVKLKSVKPDAPPPVVHADIDWNGRLLAVTTDSTGIQSVFDLFASFPKTCPPTILVPNLSSGLIASLVKQLAEKVQPEVAEITDGTPLEQGKIYVARPGDTHIIVDAWAMDQRPAGHARFLARDPVAGQRPSSSVLFASIAKALAGNAVCVMLGTPGHDGPAGLKAVNTAGGYVFAPDGVLEAEEKLELALYKGYAAQKVDPANLVNMVLKLCAK